MIASYLYLLRECLGIRHVSFRWSQGREHYALDTQRNLAITETVVRPMDGSYCHRLLAE